MHTGSCLCGGISFSSGDLPPIVVCCCSQCRRAQGGPVGTNVPISEASFSLSDPEQLLQSYESSPGKRRCFCRRCGSPVMARRDSAPGACDLHQHHVACLTLDQRCDLAVATTEQQVSFPVTRYRSIFDGSWALTDRDGVDDLAVDIGLLGVMARAAHDACPSQMLQ